MALDFALVDHEIALHDISGAHGCIPTPIRTSLLVTPMQYVFHEEHLCILCRQFSPEGYGYYKYFGDFFDVPEDAILVEDLLVQWDVMNALPSQGSKFWMKDVLTVDHSWATFCFDTTSSCLSVHENDRNPRKIRVYEMFAGAFGGWKSALCHLQEHHSVSYQTVAVEHDLNAATAYALSHSTNMLHPSTHIPEKLFVDSADSWMICKDVLDTHLLRAVTCWNPHVVTLSPPCQPWSGAAKSRGLKDFDGLIYPQSLLLCRWIRPVFILLEEVHGFSIHAHKPIIMKILAWIRYRIIWQKTVELQDHSQSQRNRWLCLCIRVHSGFSPKSFLTWPKNQDLSQHFTVLPIGHENQLKPCPKAIRFASDRQYLKNHGNIGSPGEILQKRIFREGQMLPTFMAMYGRQHQLDDALLKQHGYLGFFLADDTADLRFRYWHPFEICLLLGCNSKRYIHEDYSIAWQQIGNSIAVPHALLLLVNAINMLGMDTLSPFMVFQTFHQSKLNSRNCKAHVLARGTLWSPSSEEITSVCKEHCRALETATKTWDKTFDFWSPVSGFMDFNLVGNHDMEHFSQISTLESIPEPSPTLPMCPVIKGILHGQMDITFWHSADLPAYLLEQLWQGHFRATLPTLGDVRIDEHWHTHMHPEVFVCIRGPPKVIIILTQELNLFLCSPVQAIPTMTCCINLGARLYDQFGAIARDDINKWDLLILTQPLQEGQSPNELLFTLAAFQEGQVIFQFDFLAETFRISFVGDFPARLVMHEFWSTALDKPSLQCLGRCIDQDYTGEHSSLCFVPNGQRGIAPLPSFGIALSVAGSRMIMNQMQAIATSAARTVTIKWEGRVLWSGFLAMDTPICQVQALLQIGLSPVTQGLPIRLVNKGIRVVNDRTIGTLTNSNHRDSILLHAVAELSGGGPGSKNQQRLMQQSTLASVFLDHGYDLPWTTKTCETLVNKLSLAKLQQVTSQPMGADKLRAVHQLCAECHVPLPEPAKASSLATHSIPPWNKGKKPKRDFVQLDPKDFSICQGFFLNADGTPAPQICDLRPQTTGVCLVNTNLAASWLREGKTISSDELGLLVLGSVPDTPLPHTEVTFPCKNSDDQMVLLTAKLLQLGNKPIEIMKGSDKTINSEACDLVAITLYKEDWDPDAWKEALHSTQSFVRQTLNASGLGDTVLAIWGRSLRNQRSPASPAQATTIQIHATVISSKLQSFLN